MIMITKAGAQMLERVYACKGITQFRIDLHVSGCRCVGNRLELTACAPSDSEDCTVYEVDGYTFCVEKQLMEKAQDIIISASGEVPVLSSRVAIRV